MQKQVLFIQGGGEGAYQEDELLAASLQEALGADYTVHYPKMPHEDDPDYKVWEPRITAELDALDGKVILVGHSAGASVLLEYLAEKKVEKPITGIFLIAPPYWDEFAPLAPRIPKEPPIYLYHSRDDEVIPFSHLAMYAEKLPQAIVREFDGRGHQFNNDLSDVAMDIRSLQNL